MSQRPSQDPHGVVRTNPTRQCVHTHRGPRPTRTPNEHEHDTRQAGPKSRRESRLSCDCDCNITSAKSRSHLKVMVPILQHPLRSAFPPLPAWSTQGIIPALHPLIAPRTPLVETARRAPWHSKAFALVVRARPHPAILRAPRALSLGLPNLHLRHTERGSVRESQHRRAREKWRTGL